MKALIITGGNIDIHFLNEYILENEFEVIIAADKGLEALNKINKKPNYIIGDFDSVNRETLKQYENKKINITYLKPEKDFTDTHMALKLAIKLGVTSITIIGGFGTRADHNLANIQIMKEAMEKGIDSQIVDKNNKVKLINSNIKIKKNSEYKYISLIPLTTKVVGVTLKGFKYSLNDATLEIGQSIGVSNEQVEDDAMIKIKNGIVVLIFSKD